MKKLSLVALLLVTPGCTTISNAVGSFTHPAPNQARTLAEALQLAKIATDTVDLAVNASNFQTPTLETLRKYNNTVHAALIALEEAQAKGESLSFGAFNGAYAAFVAYAGSQHISVGGK